MTEYRTKICIKCGKELPVHNGYFPTDNTCKDGFRNICKICSGVATVYKEQKPPKFIWTDELESKLIELHFNFTHDYIINNFEEFKGLKKKHIGDKLLRLRKKYPNINLYKKESHMNLEYNYWTKEEESYIIENYNSMCNEDILKSEILKNKTLDNLINKINILRNKGLYLYKNEDALKISQENGGKKRTGISRKHQFTDETRRKLSESNKTRGYWKGDKNPRHINPLNGDKNGNWKGGITPLYFELRTQINEWKQESMKLCNYKCVISNCEFDNIHHLYPFRRIIDEAFVLLNMDIRENVSKYSTNELNILVSKITELHEKYGYGVCLSKNIHKEFHDQYGYNNFSHVDFEDFVKKNYNTSVNELLGEKVGLFGFN